MNNFERLIEAKNVYKPLLRPPGNATLPQGLKWEFVAAPPDMAHRMRDLPSSYKDTFGIIKTDRPLTKYEIEHFSLEPVK